MSLCGKILPLLFILFQNVFYLIDDDSLLKGSLITVYKLKSINVNYCFMFFFFAKAAIKENGGEGFPPRNGIHNIGLI